MSSQGRLLSNQYGIVFPTDTGRERSLIKQSTASLSGSKPNKSGSMFSKPTLSCFHGSTQEEKDFKLAVQLQHEEIDSSDSPQMTETSSRCLDAESSSISNSTEQTDIELKLMQLQHYCNYSENNE